MATLTFNNVQPEHLLSITPCKYQTSLSTLKFHCLSHFLTFFPPKRTSFLVVRAHVGNKHANSSTTDNKSPTETMNSRSREENGSGFYSFKTRRERVDRQSVKKLVSSVVEEKSEKRSTKDKNARQDLRFLKRREKDSVDSSMSSKDGNDNVKSLETTDSHVVKRKMEKKTKKGGDNQVKEEEIGKGSENNKANSSEIPLRIGLDMCSKRGDVMGAIQLYDLAQREGIKLGQYHYTVILYLCSSAAIGVIQPAKSGSGRRNLKASDVSNEVSNVEFMELSSLRDKSDSNVGATELDIRVSHKGQQLIDTCKNPRSIDKMELNSTHRSNYLDGIFNEKENLARFSNGFCKPNSQHLDEISFIRKYDKGDNRDDHEIFVSEDVKKHALHRGFEIYEKMCIDNVPVNEATLTAVARMAMSIGNGDVAFDMVKQMKALGINPRLRSYSPALTAFCSNGDVDKAFALEKHMLEHGVYPEEPELEALLRVSVEAGKADKVYYLLHELRTRVSKVSPSTAGIIVRWFKSKAASRVGKRKWDHRFIEKAIENRGGGWHGHGWLGKGKWSVSLTSVGPDAFCKCCGGKLAAIDLDPIETEKFAESVASIAIKRDRDSSFQKFQKWLDYYGPFEAVVDGANVGLFSQSRLMPSKINAVVNGIRQKLPSKKWPLIVLHNKRVTGHKMDEPVNKALIEKWKNADALYATPTGSNDDWYWLYAAIKFKCLIVTNDEMRDHTFQLLGNDFFLKWKETHQVHFSISEAGPVFHMPPPCSIVIQESDKGHWHIPIVTDGDNEVETAWLCITRAYSCVARQDSIVTKPEDSQFAHHMQTEVKIKAEPLKHGNQKSLPKSPQEIYKNLRNILLASGFLDHHTVLSKIEASEKLGGCVIDFQI